MKSALSLLALASAASAFTTAPATKSSTALNSVWDDYSGGFNFAMKDFKFDPVSALIVLICYVMLWYGIIC